MVCPSPVRPPCGDARTTQSGGAPADCPRGRRTREDAMAIGFNGGRGKPAVRPETRRCTPPGAASLERGSGSVGAT